MFWLANRDADARKIRLYQVFGERRSGTNLANALIRRNTRIGMTTQFGWKHAAPAMPCLPREVLFVVVTRDPYDWALALHRNPYEADKALIDLPFPDFLRHEWVSRYRPVKQMWTAWGYADTLSDLGRGEDLQLDRHPVSGRRFGNCLELRRIKAEGFLSLCERGLNACFLRYEDLLAAPDAVVDRIATEFRLPRKQPFRRVGWKASPVLPGDPRTKVSYSAADIAFLEGELDWGLEERLGFRRRPLSELRDAGICDPAPGPSAPADA